MAVTRQDEIRQFINNIADQYGHESSSLLSLLLETQEKYGYVSEQAMQYLADALDIPPAKVYGVATFYHFINLTPQGKFIIRLSRDISSVMKGAGEIASQLERQLGIQFGETTADGLFSLYWTGCIGMDDLAPAMLINQAVFTNLSPEQIPLILEQCRELKDSPQTLVSQMGKTMTTKLTYASHHADDGLKAALTMTPEAVIDEIAASGLCGRGGAGFPTGKKWRLAAGVQSAVHYMICNADEGEPGTFKDRVVLTEFAERVFEGMTVAAYAIGAREGIFYLRAEYTYLLAHLNAILKNRREAGLLGQDILGKAGFDFDIRIQLGAGAYICGEETALIESLEGNRGEPRDRPPYPVEVGLHGYPTVVNNVETLATVSVILARGASWFSAIGTTRSKGFKLFSVSGDCRQPGLYELPWGSSILELLKLVGGEGAKAVQVGGYSGTLIPSSAFNRRLAYEDIGAGSTVIIYGADRDMLEIVQNYLEFFVNESCGQCTPCRDGNVVLLKGIKALREGRSSVHQLENLLNLAKSICLTSKCGLGQSSPKALLTISQYFHDELTRHLIPVQTLNQPVSGHLSERSR